MPYREGQPILSEIFILAWVPLKQLVRKKLFGKRYIRSWDYWGILKFQYETGALLGRAMRDKLDILHKMLVKPGTDISRSIAFIQSEAKDRLMEFREEQGKEPDTFFDFVVFKDSEEASRVMGLSIGDAHDKDPNNLDENLRKLFDQEFTLDDVYKNILNCSLYGLGFGSSFPELTVRMYENPYKNININEWAEARSYGLNIPEKPDIIPLEEREQEILQIVAKYTSEYYPELLDPLDLRTYLDV